MSSSQDPLNRSSKPARGLGDAPDLGRVSRMRNGSTDKRPSKVTAVDGIDKRISAVMSLSGVLILCGVLVAGLGAWAFISSNNNKRVARQATALGAAPASETVDQVPPPKPSVQENVVRSFLNARTPEAIAPLIRKSDQDMPTILAKLAKLEERDGRVKRVRHSGGLSSKCLRSEGVVVEFEGGRNRLAILSPDDAGQWRVDFDGFDRYLSAGIDEILSGKALDARVRFFVSADSYYNTRFKDDEKWACYGIASPDSDQLMFGYVLRGSAQQTALDSVITTKAALRAERNRISSGRGTSKRMILDIRHHPDGEARQFEILRVLSDEWAMGPVAMDEIVRNGTGKD